MKKDRSITILKNTISNYFRQVIQIGVFVFLTPFIAGKLGTQLFGLWSLIQATVSILGLMDMGFATSVVKFVADARGKKDKERLSCLTATFFWLYVGLGTLLMIIAFVTVPWIPEMLKIEPEYAKAGNAVFLIIAFRFALAMPLGLFVGMMVSYQKQWLANLIKAGGILLYAGLAVWALTANPSIQLLAWMSLISNTLACTIGFILCIFKLPNFSIYPSKVKLKLLPEVTSFSLFFFIINISGFIYTRVDLIIVQRFLTLSSVALYAVASRVTSQVSVLCRQMTNALTPMIAELKGAKEEKNIRIVFQKGSKLTIAFAIPLLTGLFWYSKDILGIWMGEDFVGATIALRILIGATFITIIHANSNNVLAMTGQHKFLSYCFVGGQLFNLTLTLLLVRPLGIAGVALATLISTFLVETCFIQRRANNKYNFSVFGFYRLTLWPSIPGFILLIAAAWGIDQFFKPASLIGLAFLEMYVCIIFAIGFVVFGLNTKERSYYFSKIKMLIDKQRKNNKN